jgi:methionyl-tRNA formyltransferase
LRIIFLGTPEFALPSLEKLLSSTQKVQAVITRPDRPFGRGQKLSPSPVKRLAKKAGVLVIQPQRIRDEAIIEQISAMAPECLVVVAYGQIIPLKLLGLPRYGCVNVHPSLLPKYRGAAPINWAVINGDSHTGVSIMLLDEGLDSGDILTQATIPISLKDTAGTLHDKLARLGAKLLLDTLEKLEQGRISAHPQDKKGVSYAPQLKKEDGAIDWDQPADVIERRIRGFNPRPGAYTYLGERRIKVLLAETTPYVPDRTTQPGRIMYADKSHGLIVATAQGALKLKRLVPEGREIMQADQYLVGLKESLAGKVLSTNP